MPVQKQRSSILNKYGDRLRKAHDAHKNDETVISGFGNLPAGIENGIAQLVECKFDAYKEGKEKGELFFTASGVVVEPTTFTDQKGNVYHVEGLRTKISEPLYDTPDRTRKTIDEHLKWIYNELRKLGVNTAELNIDDLEMTVEALREAAPYFRFRTWQGEPAKAGKYKDKPGRINHQWNGLVQDYQPQTQDEVVDHSGSNGETPVDDTDDQTIDEVTQDEPADDQPVDETVDSGFDEFGDLDTLANKAEEGDRDAQEMLQELAERVGVTKTEMKNANEWSDVVKLIMAKQEAKNEQADADETQEVEADDEPEPEPEPVRRKPTATTTAKKPAATAQAKPNGAPATTAVWVPAKEEVYGYSPIDPKTKKPVKIPIDVEIVAVNRIQKTVDVKSLEDGKLYKSLPWMALKSPS